MKKKAFTLVELLVVISIIALLLSILMPVLSKAKEQANRVICSSNEKQILLAHNQFAMDNKDRYPVTSLVTSSTLQTIQNLYSSQWQIVKRVAKSNRDIALVESGYLRTLNIWQCGSDRELGTGYENIERTLKNRRSYAVNIAVDDKWGWKTPGGMGLVRTTDTKQAAATVLIVEQHHVNNFLGLGWFSAYFGPITPNGYAGYPGNAIWAYSRKQKFAHGKGFNFGFVDNHVEFIKPIVQKPGELDLQKQDFPPLGWYTGIYEYKPK